MSAGGRMGVVVGGQREWERGREMVKQQNTKNEYRRERERERERQRERIKQMMKEKETEG